jgi:hypothetical protein
MKWSELKKSQRGAGGKPRGWRPTPVQEFAERLKKLKPGERAYYRPARELTEAHKETERPDRRRTAGL